MYSTSWFTRGSSTKDSFFFPPFASSSSAEAALPLPCHICTTHEWCQCGWNAKRRAKINGSPPQSHAVSPWQARCRRHGNTVSTQVRSLEELARPCCSLGVPGNDESYGRAPRFRLSGGPRRPDPCRGHHLREPDTFEARGIDDWRGSQRFLNTNQYAAIIFSKENGKWFGRLSARL